jgi:hypothetical protein
MGTQHSEKSFSRGPQDAEDHFAIFNRCKGKLIRVSNAKKISDFFGNGDLPFGCDGAFDHGLSSLSNSLLLSKDNKKPLYVK